MQHADNGNHLQMWYNVMQVSLASSRPNTLEHFFECSLKSCFHPPTVFKGRQKCVGCSIFQFLAIIIFKPISFWSE